MIDSIGRMATQLSQAQLQRTLGVLVAREQLDITEDLAHAQLQLITPEELDPNVGQNLNVKF